MPIPITLKGYGPTTSLGDQHAMVSNVFLNTTLPQRFNPPTIFNPLRFNVSSTLQPTLQFRAFQELLFYLGEKYLVQTTSVTFLFPQMNSAVFPLQLFFNPLQSISFPSVSFFQYGGALSLNMFHQHGGAFFSFRFLCRWRFKIRKDGGVSQHLQFWFFPDLQAMLRSQLVFDSGRPTPSNWCLIFLIGPTFLVLPSNIVSFWWSSLAIFKRSFKLTMFQWNITALNFIWFFVLICALCQQNCLLSCCRT